MNLLLVDAAWEGLYGGVCTAQAVRRFVIDQKYVDGVSALPKEEAARLANRTAPYPGDEGHYIITLDAFHQLVSGHDSANLLWQISFLTNLTSYMQHCLVRSYVTGNQIAVS